jgi:hypothetical protein
MGVSATAARAAKEVLIIAEEVVDPEVIRSDPNRTIIPGFIVSGVVEEPWGAHPSAVQGYYGHDDPVYLEYAHSTRTEKGSREWFQDWVYRWETAGVYRSVQLIVAGAEGQHSALPPTGWILEIMPLAETISPKKIVGPGISPTRKLNGSAMPMTLLRRPAEAVAFMELLKETVKPEGIEYPANFEWPQFGPHSGLIHQEIHGSVHTWNFKVDVGVNGTQTR